MSKTTSKTSKLGGGCLFLFALPFAAVGVFMLGWIGKDLLAWQAMQSWVPVSAQLDAVNLDPKDTATWNFLAAVLGQLGQYDQAIKAYEGSLAADANQPQVTQGIDSLKQQLQRGSTPPQP